MKILKAIHHDSGSCRLYVTDEAGRKYVLLDQGHSHEKAGLPRFELFKHTLEGEPDTPVSCCWKLETGVEESAFPSGLSSKSKELQVVAINAKHQANVDKFLFWDKRYSEIVDQTADSCGRKQELAYEKAANYLSLLPSRERKNLAKYIDLVGY